MRVFSIDAPDAISGLKILDYQYSRNISNLAGDWSLTLESADVCPISVGDSVTLTGMTGGLVTSVQTGANGEFLLDGKDRGVYLLKSIPADVDDIAEGGSMAVISALAGMCGLSASGSGGLTGFNARSLITSNTCAEAIQELCLLSGKIAHIGNDGNLIISDPSTAEPDGLTVISESGESLDLDGYATGATVIVQRRRESDAESAGGVKTVWRGETPSGLLRTETYSGSLHTPEGLFSYETEVYEQIKVPVRTHYSIVSERVTKTHDAVYEYDTDTWVELRGDQEYRIFEWALLSGTTTSTMDGIFEASDLSEVIVSETTTKSTTCSYNLDGSLDSEVEESVTTREASGAGGSTIPSIPPFDYHIERKYAIDIFGQNRVMTETEQRYEKQSLSRLVPVINAATNEHLTITLPSGERFILLPQVEFDDWVLVKTTRTVHEVLDKDECVVRASIEQSDNGSEYLLAQGYSLPVDVEDPTVKDSENAFVALDRDASLSQIEVLPGGSTLTGDRQRVELEGRRRVYITRESSIEGAESWYYDGDYLPTRVCPHYTGGMCGIADIEVVGGSLDGDRCPYRGVNWTGCERAKAALEKARADDEDNKLLETPVICSSGSGDVWMSREVYIDDIITDEQAEAIGNAIAANILTAKGGTRGVSKNITVPLDYSRHPTGVITGVSHDWKNMKSTIMYKVERVIPEILIPNTVSSAAALVANREATRQQRGYVGKVALIGEDGVITVLVANMPVRCRTRLRYLAENDTVLVSMPGGARGFGVVTERL